MTSGPIHIAIIGGGLGGLILASSLMNHANLDVHIYEAKTEPRERGASVGLNANGQRALKLIGLPNVMRDAKGVQMNSLRLIVGSGPHSGKHITDPVDNLVTAHRAALLQELIRPITPDRIHFNKRLTKIEDGHTIYFEDGTTATADLIVGADGIHSKVRRCCFGEGEPYGDPIFAGFWDARIILPMDRIKDKPAMFRTNISDPRQHSYIGNRCYILHDIVDDGASVCLIAAGTAPPYWNIPGQWKREVSREWLEDHFDDWGDLGATTLELMLDGKDELSVFIERETPSLPKLFEGTICLMGDAAHATTPWQGNGLATAIEDALILKTLLVRCNGTKDIPFVLEAYDDIMAPRGEYVIESSRETGLVCCGSIGLDPGVLAEDLGSRWDFITQWDTEGAMREAISKFEHLRGSD